MWVTYILCTYVYMYIVALTNTLGQSNTYQLGHQLVHGWGHNVIVCSEPDIAWIYIASNRLQVKFKCSLSYLVNIDDSKKQSIDQ